MAQIETKFYAQTKIDEKDDQLEKLSQRCNSYISQILTKIQTGDDAYLKSSAVKTFVHQNPSEKDSAERKNLTAQLFDELESYGLDGIRLIEKNGRTLHYSSYETDVLKRVSLNTTYKLYTDIVKDSNELESELLLVDADNPETKILLDKSENRLVISFPFYITDNTYFATLVCYFDLYSFEQQLVNEKIINFGDSFVTLTPTDAYDGGFVLGLPKTSQSEFFTPILNAWNKTSKTQNKELSLERILEKDDGSYWLLMTSADSEYFKVSAVYSSTLFELPRELEYLIYACVFMTLLLLAALIFNLKRDYLAVIKSRIKKVQFGIINEYLENKEKVEWSQVARQLENRKAELSEEIKKSIGGKSKKYSKQVDAYLDSSWEEIIGLLKAQTGGDTEASGAVAGGATIEEIRRVIEEVLRTSKLNVNVAPVGVQQVEDVAEVEEVEALDDVEEVEALDDVEPVDEIEEVEEVEEVEALDDAEPVEEIEEVEEVEALDDAEEIEEVESLDDAEPVEEIEEVEEVESLDDAEPVEDIEEVEEVEELEDTTVPEPVEGPVEEIDDVEEVEEVEPIDDAEPVEEVEEVEEVETLDDAEPVEEIDEVEEIEELEEYVVDTSMLDTIDSHYSVSNDDPRFHEEFYIGELDASGVPSEYPDATEPLEFEFVVEEPKFALRQAQSPQDGEVQELEELSDDVEELPKKSQPYFVMTKFGQNDEPVVELVGDGDTGNGSDTIIERNGVYSISDNLSYTNVFLNQEFKTLVDSVLQK
ncbi:MAG: hypothetical protein J5710_06250 [Treponema sp.]|nr:hypothetical protein [Treponema sp.]